MNLLEAHAGMMSNETLRLMELLNILRLKKEKCQVFKVQTQCQQYLTCGEQNNQVLINSIKVRGEPVVIASNSNMRVGRRGHSDLLGSGNPLHVEQNIILDTQVIIKG